MKILYNSGIICDLISVNRRLVGFSKQDIIFRILCKFKTILKN